MKTKQILSFFPFFLVFCSCLLNKQKPTTNQSLPAEQTVILEQDINNVRPTITQNRLIFVIAGINDLHGTLFPIQSNQESIDTKENPHSILYTKGGAPILASYIKQLRNEYKDQLIVLDAGDEFQGSLESNMTQQGPGAPMVQFLNSILLQAAAVGNHEFDFGQDVLKARMTEAHYPFVASNILEKGTKRLPPFPHMVQHLIIQSGPAKIGIIGLSTIDTPTTTRPKLVSNLEFTALREATLEQAQALREKNVDLILMVAHVGLFCSSPKESSGLRLRSPTDPQGTCRPQEELTTLLASLPAGTVHGVISGHTHQVIHHFVSQGGQPIPVIQGGHHGQYLNLIYFPYDLQKKKFLFQDVKIEGPIPLCEKVFSQSKNCNKAAGELKVPSFHGNPIFPDPETIKLLTPLKSEMKEKSQQVIGYTEAPLSIHGPFDSPLAHLLTISMLDATTADLALINPGGIRSPIPSGPITYEVLFRTLPFDNKLCTLTVSGEELLRIIKTSQAKGQRPFPSAGITMELLSKEDADRCTNGEMEQVTDLRIKKIEFWNGKVFDPKQSYKIALADFLVEGGSHLHTAITDRMRATKDCSDDRVFRDIVKDYIEKQKGVPINSVKNPLNDPLHPHRIWAKPALGPLTCF